MKLGAPLHTVKYLLPSSSGIPPGHNSDLQDTSLTVSIIFRDEEKGTSKTRAYSLLTTVSDSPTFLAATTMGASDEFPFGSYFSSPVSGSLTLLNVVLQQRSAASSDDFTAKSLPASAWVSARWMRPSVGSKPLPSMVYPTPPANILTMVILPSVRVPVLSLQMTEADPSVSTAASLRTSTFFLTISLQPMDREMVTQSGMPSGMAATASVTAIRTMYSQEGPVKFEGSRRSMATPMTKITTQTMIAKTPMRAPRRSKFTCRGVAFADVSGKHPHFFLLLPPSASAMS
mmetsp:Transcript_57019/g.144767  ORF Transcript_57019/g.144767 Transcript_57019/m.144767 type:complete len:288 (+) Transcript_57019:1880-2743(+)